MKLRLRPPKVVSRIQMIRETTKPGDKWKSFTTIGRPIPIRRLMIPRFVIERKVVTLTLPKIDAKPLWGSSKSLAWRLLPQPIKYKIERKRHAKDVARRFDNGNKPTQEYLDYDWEMIHSPWPKQHELTARFLDLDMKTNGFIKPVEKHVPIPPRSAMIGNGMRVWFDPETGEEVARFNIK